MTITWKRCLTYEEAKDYKGVIYLHEWDGEPFYWGKAHNSYFGGSRRSKDGVSGRYNPGYRHWIEGVLQHGGRLYIGVLDQKALNIIDDVELFLINEYGTKVNRKGVGLPAPNLNITHQGDLPDCIKNVS